MNQETQIDRAYDRYRKSQVVITLAIIVALGMAMMGCSSPKSEDVVSAEAPNNALPACQVSNCSDFRLDMPYFQINSIRREDEGSVVSVTVMVVARQQVDNIVSGTPTQDCMQLDCQRSLRYESGNSDNLTVVSDHFDVRIPRNSVRYLRYTVSNTSTNANNTGTVILSDSDDKDNGLVDESRSEE